MKGCEFSQVRHRVYLGIAVCIACATLATNPLASFSRNWVLSGMIRPLLAGDHGTDNCATILQEIALPTSTLPQNASQVGYRIAAYALNQRGCYTVETDLWSQLEQSDHLDQISSIMRARELEEQRRFEDADRYFQLAGSAMEAVASRINESQIAAQNEDYAVAAEYLLAALRLGDMAVVEDKAVLSEYSAQIRQTWNERRGEMLRDVGWYLYHLPGRLDDAIDYYELSLQEKVSAYTTKLLAMAWLSKEQCSLHAMDLLESVLLQDPNDPMAQKLMNDVQLACQNNAAQDN
jgi:tetratricopeptide (TPR) repeat protein